MSKNLLTLWLMAMLLGGCSKSHQENQNQKLNPIPSAQVPAFPGQETTVSFLDRLYANPAKVMDEAPAKTNARGEVVSASRFAEEEKESGDFVEIRDQKRKMIMARTLDKASLETKAAILEDGQDSEGSYITDAPERLVDAGSNLIRNLRAMEGKNLRAAKLASKPWSDDYWAIKNGVLGYRYNDEAIPSHGNWKDIFDYSHGNPVSNYIEKGQVNLLSPSEKYDYLVGDRNGSLTKSMWAEGKVYFERDGNVEPWMGICHGWAPAAYMLPRPAKAISLRPFNGGPAVTFFPSDIKALGSLLWAKAAAPTRFIGGRCNNKNAKKDAKGRILDQECFDTNPGSWHMAVVNQLGVSKRSFVLDATFDYEVWNQPVYSYSYKYFNPQTGKVTERLDEAKIPVHEFARDLFRSYRSQEATHIVGIEMGVEYIVETSPSHSLTDSPERDAVYAVVYRYDLELDAQGNILGGEWYSNAHPDFLWTPVKGKSALSDFDNYVRGEWNPKMSPVYGDWARVATYASKQGLPLAKIVEALFKWSSEVTGSEVLEENKDN